MDLVQFLQREWTTLSSAPFTFFLLLVIAYSLAYVSVRWRYDAITEILQGRVEMLKERLEAKDEQLNGYRERVHQIPSGATSYSRLLNADLRLRALNLVSRIRDFLKERRTAQESFISPSWQSKTEEERARAWQENTNRLLLESQRSVDDYDSQFKVDAILLRDEILTRLPAQARRHRDYLLFEHPTNMLGMTEVADELERLAKSLPTDEALR